jgi:NitT/TauT family transport system ATP-binding protein
MGLILEVKGLVKEFNTAQGKITALDGIDFTAKKGEFTTIIGPSGCGKSTLLRCIAGLEVPGAGTVKIRGESVKGPGPDRMMVFQGFEQLFPWLTVLENVTYPLKVAHMGRNQAERRKIGLKHLELVGLLEYASLYPYQLSGGMKQRVAIARALSISPQVLLMDEPFGSLDALTRTHLQKCLISIWKKTKATILFVTHNIEEAISLSTNILVLKAGRIEKVITNELPLPRSPESPEFARLWDILHKLLEPGHCIKESPVPLIGEKVGLAY